MATNVTNPYTDLHDDESGKMVIASKMGYWDTVWEILNRKPYLVNCIPEERAWAILHQAVWWKHAIAVKNILAVPGCDSELLTKNGLRPLDIETTAEIRKLLEQHIAQVNGWEETTQEYTVETNIAEANGYETPQVAIAETKNKEILFKVDEDSEKIVAETTELISKMNEQTFQKIVMKDEEHTKVMGRVAKSRSWKELFSLLDKWKNLVNKTDPDTGMALLHYAAVANDIGAVQKILYYPACDPAVKTTKGSSYGAGKTAAKITTSLEVKAAIRWKEKKLQEKHTDIPAFVYIHDSNLIMMRYTAQAMNEYRDEICHSNLNTEFLQVFPEMGWFIFDFINSGDTNWTRAKVVALKEIHKFDADMCDDVSRTTKKDAFYKQLIKCYTTNNIYKQLKTELKAQAINQNNTDFKAYTSLVNALLFENSLKLPVHTETTYRAAGLSNSDFQKYTIGREFAWLTFASSSSMESVARKHAQNFNYNCIFIIDNSQRCVWSPKGIAEISKFKAEDEYLYPCGAQFRVTDVKNENGMTKIYLKLICQTEPREFVPIFGNNLENKANEIRESIANLIEKRRCLENRKNQLLIKCKETEKNKDYKTQIIQIYVTKENLITGSAFNCTKCRHTCQYPCPEPDITSSLNEGHCKECPNTCHFVFHKRENFRYKMEPTTEYRINEQIKAKFDRAKLREETEERRVEAKQRELNVAIQTVRTKLTEWDEMTSQFDERLRQEQATARADSVRMLKRYDNNKALVQTARFQLEEDELI